MNEWQGNCGCTLTQSWMWKQQWVNKLAGSKTNSKKRMQLIVIDQKLICISQCFPQRCEQQLERNTYERKKKDGNKEEKVKVLWGSGTVSLLTGFAEIIWVWIRHLMSCPWGLLIEKTRWCHHRLLSHGGLGVNTE